MILTNESLLGNTPYSGASDLHGDPVIAANYYGGNGGTQTATIVVTGFEGLIKFQATLNDQLGQALWFDVDEFGGAGPYTETASITMIGNFCYMRVYVTEFTAGTINSITLTY